jgi:hypothetical protein
VLSPEVWVTASAICLRNASTRSMVTLATQNLRLAHDQVHFWPPESEYPAMECPVFEGP